MNRAQNSHRRLSLQTLERRQLLAADFLVPADSGVIDVTDLPAEVLAANPGLTSATPDDGIDDTTAIQAALDFYPASNRIIFLPDGVYEISDTLRWPNGRDDTTGDDAKLVTLEGESRDGAILKLADGIAPDAEAAFPVLNTGFAPAQRFANNIRSLTIDTGVGNPGAVGAEWIANNRGTFRDVLIRSGDGQGLVGLSTGFTSENGPALVKNVEVVGFDIGVTAASNEYGLTFENITLSDQNFSAISNTQQSPFFRNLRVTGDVPVAVSRGPGGTLHVSGGVFENTGEPLDAAIYNEQGNDAFLQDITATGYDAVFASTARGSARPGPTPYGEITGTHGVGSIDLFTTTEPISAFDLGPAELIGITPVETPEPAADPNFDNWANVVDFGADPNDLIDDTAAIQAAIDSGATTVYFPNTFRVFENQGTFLINGDLVVRGAVERVTGFEGRISGRGSVTFADGDSPLLTWERIQVVNQVPGTSAAVGTQADVNFIVDTDRDVLVRHASFGQGIIGDVDRFAFRDADGQTTDVEIEAETVDATDCVGVFRNNTVIGSIHDRDWARYDAVDFGDGGLDRFTARLSALGDSGRVDVRLGAVDGPLIASAAFPETQSFTAFADVDVPLLGDVSGVHDVYLVFSGGVGFSAFGEGRLFLEDFLSGFLRVGDGKEVYARQLNAEGPGDQIVNDGGQLWVFGHKSENDNTTFVTLGGGVTEVIGSYAISGTNQSVGPEENPLFEVVDSAFAVSYRERNTGSVIDPFEVVLRDTRDGVTREVGNSPAGAQDLLFAAYTADQVPPPRYAATGSIIQAESFAGSSDGVGVYATPGGGEIPSGGQKVGSIGNGDFVRYRGVDLGDAGDTLRLRLASRRASTLEVRADSPEGRLLGTVDVRNTGGWDNFENYDLTLPVGGVRDVVLVARGGGSALVDIDWLSVLTDRPGFGADPAAESFVQAEAFDSASGVGTYRFAGGEKVGAVSPGDFVNYRGVDLGDGGQTLSLRVSSAIRPWQTASIEVRSGAIDGPLLGVVPVGNTGGWDSFDDLELSLPGDVSGPTDLFLIGRGSAPALWDLDRLAVVPPRVATETIEAELFGSENGVGIFGGGTEVLRTGDAQAGDWLRYPNVDFGDGVGSVEMRLAGFSSTAAVEVRLGSPTGTQIARIVPGNTDNGRFMVDAVAELSVAPELVAGVHDVYLVFTGTSNVNGLIDVDKFRFLDPVVPASGLNRFEAEDYIATGGVGVDPNTGQPGAGRFAARTVAGSIQSGDWLRYGEVDFGDAGVGQLTLRYAAPRPSTLQVRDGGPDGTLLAELPLRQTGFGFGTYRQQTFDIGPLGGTADLTLVALGEGGALVDLDWFQFASVDAPVTRSATQIIQAESFSAIDNGIGVFGGGTVLGSINSGESVTYSNLDFGVGTTEVTFRYGSPVASTIELSYVGQSGVVTQRFDLTATGSFGSLTESTFDLLLPAGAGDITLTFVGGSGGPLLDLDWLVFA